MCVQAFEGRLLLLSSGGGFRKVGVEFWEGRSGALGAGAQRAVEAIGNIESVAVLRMRGAFANMSIIAASSICGRLAAVAQNSAQDPFSPRSPNGGLGALVQVSGI